MLKRSHLRFQRLLNRCQVQLSIICYIVLQMHFYLFSKLINTFCSRCWVGIWYQLWYSLHNHDIVSHFYLYLFPLHFYSIPVTIFFYHHTIFQVGRSTKIIYRVERQKVMMYVICTTLTKCFCRRDLNVTNTILYSCWDSKMCDASLDFMGVGR